MTSRVDTHTDTHTDMHTDRHADIETELDEFLGDTDESVRRAGELDAEEAFPALCCAQLDAFGLPGYYVPAEWGGALDDHERLLRLMRAVARRDLSATIAHAKTYLGTASVWIAGSAEQKSATAAAVLSGAPFAWGLSEAEHGADLLHGSLTATPVAGGYRLDGAKWPINNATRGSHLVLLARTGPGHAARDFSLFLVDKRALPPDTARPLPKVRTHGIRGIDISGIEFTGATVDHGALLGPAGSGIETVLRALQLTRTMCAVLSVGAGEHALRLVAPFVATRIVQRAPLGERPYPASILARCAALLAATEAAALVGSRSVHSLTGELSVISAVVKSLAPTLVDAMIGELAELLGARSYLTTGYRHGAFQKVWRDHQVVSVFDGSTPVNRGALAQQFPTLSRAYAAGTFDTDGLAEAVAIGRRPRQLDRDALLLRSRQGCSLVQSLPSLAAEIGARGAPTGVVEYAKWWCEAIATVTERMAGIRPAARPAMAAYELAEAYELGFAAAACLHLWVSDAERHRDDPLWTGALWLRGTLRVLLVRMARVLRVAPPATAPGDEQVDGLLSRRIAAAAMTGGPVTPFGRPSFSGTSDAC